MKHIDYIDGSGLGALVAAHFSANTQGAAMRLCNLGRKLSKVLQLTKVDDCVPGVQH
jgi:anti-anti-sigma factor